MSRSRHNTVELTRVKLVQRRSFLREEWTVEAVHEDLFKFAMADTASSSDPAMADTQRRGSHERSVVCGSTAEGPGSASYSKWPRLQADTHPEHS